MQRLFSSLLILLCLCPLLTLLLFVNAEYSVITTPAILGGPILAPTSVPTSIPILAPTSIPTSAPILAPTGGDTSIPNSAPTSAPILAPTGARTGTLTLCDPATQSGVCSNLGNISYPFGGVEPCAASDSFIINCSDSTHAFWDGFIQALPSNTDKLGAPAVGGISSTGFLSFINLTWNLGFAGEGHACSMPLPADSVNTYIPDVINLSSFANSSFQFSYYNHILLLNCTKLPPSLLQADSSTCAAYEEQCSHLQNTPCAQIPVPTQELMLHQALSNYSCSHFQFFVASGTILSIPSWSPGLIQLVHGDSLCVACSASNGQCIYDQMTQTYRQCACGSGTYSNTDCHHIHGCEGFKCNTSAKIAVGTTAMAVALTIIGIVVLRHCKRRSLVTKTLSPSFTISRLDLDGLTERPTEYQYASIARATKEFSNTLGEGGFGAVYKGVLGDARDNERVQIAVKVLGVRSKHCKKQFLNEVASIGRIHHVHVVRLLGFCIKKGHEMLVYEYVINGSLDQWLFHRSGRQNRGRVLLWEQRYSIAIGIARGLSYLHEECRHRIVHCDIKPHNILLDEQMHPKIADFGLARLMGREESRVATLARGTPGYVGPEFWLGGESQLTTKFDVYSYGMVLLELISGQRNFGQDVCFPEMAFEAAMRGECESIMDVELRMTKASDGECMRMDGLQRQQVQTALLVALWCIQDHPGNRPSMSEVVQYLEGIAAVNERPPRPTIAASLIIANSAPQHSCLSSDIQYSITSISGGR